jgi:hypothetical protein
MGVLSAPVLLIAGPLAGWAAFVAKRYRASRWAMVAPPLWLAYTAIVVLLLDTLCRGPLGC